MISVMFRGQIISILESVHCSKLDELLPQEQEVTFKLNQSTFKNRITYIFRSKENKQSSQE